MNIKVHVYMCARNTVFCIMLTTKILIMHVDNYVGGPEPKRAKLAIGSTAYVAAEKVSGRLLLHFPLYVRIMCKDKCSKLIIIMTHVLSV